MREPDFLYVESWVSPTGFTRYASATLYRDYTRRYWVGLTTHLAWVMDDYGYLVCVGVKDAH